MKRVECGGSLTETRREFFSGDSWYFRARKRVLSDFVKKHLPVGSRALDVGCGDGWLAEASPGYEWHGVEPEPVLREKALTKGMLAVPGEAEKLPFPDGHFDAVCLFDVLEHLPDESAALKETRRVLKSGGLLFVSVPLHPELWSEHDERCEHCRRYRKGEVKGLLEKSGFRLLEKRYFISLPLPFVWAARKLRRDSPGKLPGMLDRLAEAALVLDAFLCLPFGLSEVSIFEDIGQQLFAMDAEASSKKVVLMYPFSTWATPWVRKSGGTGRSRQ